MTDERSIVETIAPESMTDEEFLALYDRLNRPLYYFFIRRGFSHEESRDLSQETFLAALKARGRFRAQSSPETWLIGIAMNIWRGDLRHRQRDKRQATLVPLESLSAEGEMPHLAETPLENHSTEVGPLQEFLSKERIDLLRTALAELPERMRHCVVLRLKDDLKYHEIATILQVSINTVRSQLFHARSKLRNHLGDHFTDVSP